jgi:Holliday junction resolvase RusA-like endonuclease
VPVIELYLAGINPVPWKAPSLGIGRAKGKPYPTAFKDAELDMYQQAVKAELELILKGEDFRMFTGAVDVQFFFWRLRDSYQGKTRRVVKQAADATNMQKALEDACQGILFKNDSQVRRITSTIVQQDQETVPAIGIRVSDFIESLVSSHPIAVTGTEESKVVSHVR